MKNNKDKQRLIDELRKTPIVEVACQKANISRASYYRFRKQDAKFAALADQAIDEGRAVVNDLGEAQTISLMKERDMGAIKFWLAHNNPRYSNKLELKGALIHTSETLTPEQEKLLQEALRLALPKNEYDKEPREESPLDPLPHGEGQGI